MSRLLNVYLVQYNDIYRGTGLKVIMENSQSVQHEPSQATVTTPNLANNTSKPIHLLAKHPWILLLGLLLIPVSIAVFAFGDLTQVVDVGQDQAEKSPNVKIEEPIKTPADKGNVTPLWVTFAIGYAAPSAIALSCGTGCWLIWRTLKTRKHLRKIHKQIKRNQPLLVQSGYQTLKPNLSKQAPDFILPPSLKEVFTNLPQSEHLVTVLPPEESHHLDDSTEPLAELLDIRKQSSLSSILRFRK
jgi:hypothetical protein